MDVEAERNHILPALSATEKFNSLLGILHRSGYSSHQFAVAIAEGHHMRRHAFEIAAATALVVLAAATPAAAKCTRLAFSVNDYGKDGPTKDAKSLLDKYIAQWTAERGIKSYRTGKKDVNCELFLNLIVFDEHTCRAEATVCWDDKNVGPAPRQSATLPDGAAPATAKPKAPAKPKTVAPAAAAPAPLTTGTIPAPARPMPAPAVAPRAAPVVAPMVAPAAASPVVAPPAAPVVPAAVPTTIPPVAPAPAAPAPAAPAPAAKPEGAG
jgi:hypothetical protein